MDIDALRLFAEVAQRGSFAAVARDRDSDPSSVSRAIAGLEAELGFRLFQRTTRSMALTEGGEIYLARIAAVIEEIEQAREQALALRRQAVGTLRLTASVAFGTTCLMPLLPRLRERYPDLKLELLLTDSNLDLVSERIDLAVRLGAEVEGDVIATRLFDTRYRVCASPDYVARHGPLKRPGDLSARRCLLFALPDFRSRWLLRDAAGAVAEVPVDGDIVISSALALHAAALAGLGPALLANWMVDGDIAAGRLLDLLPDHEVTATTFDTAAWLLYPSRSYLPNKVRVTIDFLKKALA